MLIALCLAAMGGVVRGGSTGSSRNADPMLYRQSIDSACAVKVVNGALASATSLDYHLLKSEGFEKCPELVEAASILATVNFNFDDRDENGAPGLSDMVKNLNSLSEVFQALKPAWKGCKPVRDALGRDDFNRVH